MIDNILNHAAIVTPSITNPSNTGNVITATLGTASVAKMYITAALKSYNTSEHFNINSMKSLMFQLPLLFVSIL